ncbi:micrococcal nuclease-like nuclease [Rhizobium leguminosarum bv. trifolii WSM2297]|uniref:Micrococcal nuclease-like nuclease n=1 Tax=Rhizobium leguminosarum bv. trifolii WSM2297 TaxID=754762 RepID=J0W4J1_RHILT|nr:thermonuclease family protein [Rhizobium leguminosarum]EJC80651.1 micrococcal nuclease-like nuclease [Rhizobium leguminosarum bv. trifolii WSM2297]
MLSEQDIAYFRRRIDEVLQSGHVTKWQRQFLSDIRDKMARYGVRTRVSEKQFAILKRLTQDQSPAPKLEVVLSEVAAALRQPRQRQVSNSYSIGAPFERASRNRNPFRLRNPLRPRNPFRLRNPFRPRYPFCYASGAGRDSLLIVIGFILFVGLLGSFFGRTVDGVGSAEPQVGSGVVANAPSRGSANFTITDGDTIRLNNGTRVRLIGFNTPEKFEPLCSNEAKLGNRASERLQELVGRANTTNVSLVACSCKPGTEGTKKCNYGRSCGKLEVDGRDVGQILIDEGLAVPFVCGATGCPPTPRPWCG